jgi:predicted glycosyltransferase involved in capsule biosynthesis
MLGINHNNKLVSIFLFSLNIDCYFGGIQAFKGEHFIRINGYSNMYNGWGGEDDDLLLR